MSNLNFTSSSFAQQDRYAQTTVSYESRNMQSIPFYPGVDHKAKMRGILALTLVYTVIIGAVLGILFGLRDYIVDWAENTPVYTAIVGDGEETPPPADDEMNVSPSADSSEAVEKIIVLNGGNGMMTVDYNGTQRAVTYEESATHAQLGDIKVTFAWMTTTASDSWHHVDAEGWPKNAGTYLVKAVATLTEFGTGKLLYTYEDAVTVVINKAAIGYPELNLPAASDREYNGSVKEVSLKNSLPSDYTGGYTIEYKLDGKKVSSIKDAGTYSITLSIKGDKNYKAATFGGTTVTVTKQKVLYNVFNDAFADDSVIYNGKAQEILLDLNKIPAGYENLVAELKANSSAIQYKKTVESPTNVGNYVIEAIINSKNYEIVGKITASLAITPADLTQFFTFKDVSVTYDTMSVEKELLEIKALANFPDIIAEKISIAYTYYNNTGKEITAADILNAGSYKATVTFATGTNYKTPDPITINITVKKADINLDAIKVTPVSGEYTGKNISIKESNISGLPAGVKADLSKAYAKNAGEHRVTITLSGANYNTTTITGDISISKAMFTDPDFFVTALEVQSATKDGKVHLPKLDASSVIPEGAWIEYYVNGREIEGVDRLGTYKIDIVVTDENHIFTLPVTFSLNFNFITILMGVIIGVVAGLIIGPCIWLGFRMIEKSSFKKFARLRARILHERGGARGAIVCEGRTTIINTNSEQEIRDFPWVIEPRFGRLYLTHATLEYYDGDYKKNYRNFLIQLKDVTGVEIRGVFLRNKLIVFAKGGSYTFYVEPNTAYLWRRDILHFRNLQHLYPMENNVVDNDYPFNYTVVSDAD